MEVKYDVTEKDVIRFVLYCVDHSPTIRRSMLVSTLVLIAMFIGLGFMEYERTGSRGELVYFGVAAAGSILYVPLYYRWETKRRMQRLLREGPNRGLIGPCTLTIEPDGLQAVGEAGQSSLKWAIVEKIVLSDTHTYIYTGVMSALMIPHAAFADIADRDRFVETAQRYRETAAGKSG